MRGGTLVEALPPEYRPPTGDRAPNVLGMTETGGPHTGPDDAYAVLPESLRGTMGRSLPGMEHVVVDVDTGAELPTGEEGELLLRGAFLMDGFYKRERHETFTPDGWYATGDLGWFGADGYLRFSGRRTAMIKTGGSNVSPAEVETGVDGAAGCARGIRVRDPGGERGEDVAAVVVPEGPDAVELTALRALAPGRALELQDPETPAHRRGKRRPEAPNGEGRPGIPARALHGGVRV